MKIIELADLHINPKWLELQKPVLRTIIETGEKEKPDFICIVGDIWDRPFYNSDKDCITFVLEFMSDLQKIAPVVMITGTPSHDAPGSYAIFQKMGCHVLNPVQPEIINGCLFIGCQEIDKIHFMNHYSLKNNAECNTAIIQLFEKYINVFWAPIREANKNIPCVFLGHGCFVDNPYDNNPIIKNSDIVIDNNKLAEIKADRYIFGHFHTPGESIVLNGEYVGYAGFDRSPWNNTGFQPGFNVTEIYENYDYDPEKEEDDVLIFTTKTTRIDYPVIRKEKINCDNIKLLDNLDIYYKLPGCDFRVNLKISKGGLLKIDINKLQNKLKKQYYCNSVEIIPEIIKEESQRITHEQAEKIKTLWEKYCFFKGWEDINSHSIICDKFKPKINEIEKNVSLKTQSQETKIIKLLFLEVHGSIFSLDAQGKNTFTHDFNKDPQGLTLIAGDNGQGKSTYMGFASPYPMFIGWDYRSLKDFFPENGYIKKRFSVNGIIHEHVIMISQKKIECYWYEYTDTIPNKIPVIKAVQLKDFMEECEKFFGPVSSFISTSFFAQEPGRMKKWISSITSSSATELRNAYLEIVGISREQEKLYAREKKDNLKNKITEMEIKKNTMNEFLKEKDNLENEKNKLETDLERLVSILTNIEFNTDEKQKEFDNIKKEYDEQKKLDSDIINIQKNLYEKNINKNTIQKKINQLEKINIAELTKQLSENQKIKNKIDFLRDQWEDINKKRNKILEDIQCKESAVSDFNEKINHGNHLIKLSNTTMENKSYENKLLLEPCEQCGYIKNEKKEQSKKNLKIIENEIENIKKLSIEIKKFTELKQEYENYTKQQKEKLPDSELQQIREKADKLKKQLLTETKIAEIQTAINEYSQTKVYQENLNIILADIMELNCQINDLTGQKNPFIEDQYNKIEKELSELKIELQEKNNELSGKNATLEVRKKQIGQIKEYEKQILELTKKLEVLKTDHLEWETIEKDMMPNKLPALELELIAQEIDFQVNQKLNGRYIIRTVTQDINKKGEIIDRFDILVYNPKSGIEKPLLAHSPGQRAAYFIEPISQALRDKRQQREKIIFLWSVADETDNPIKYERVREYYEIMAAGLPENHTRFVMSQKSEIYQFIKNTINIEEIGKNI